MARQFNINNYQFDYEKGKWFVYKTGSFVRKATRLKIENYYKSQGLSLPYATEPKKIKKQNTRIGVDGKIKDYFRKDVNWKTYEGHLTKWARPLTAKGGENPNYNWRKVQYYNPKSPDALGKTSNRWGTDVGGGKGTSVGILNGSRDFIKHLQIAIHAVTVNAANFRVMAGQRAMKVFQTSFVKRRFYNKGARAWRKLSDYTKNKRKWRGTGTTILDEYGDLKNSIKLKESVGKFLTQIYTDIVPANASKHKKRSICYAGYHNEGKGQYGRSWKGHKPHRYYTRRFMGHSSHLDPLQDAFMMKTMRLYLFDNVFLIKQK